MNLVSSSIKTLCLGLIVSMAMTSCKKDKDTEPEPEEETPSGYTVPASYSFTNVDYSGQTIRMIMLDSISNYMTKGNTGMVLDATVMKNMYSNTGSPFGNPALDASGKQLKNKTFLSDQVYFDALFDSLAVASQSAGAAASNGVAGLDGGRLFDKNGVEISQVIKKQLMGAVFYYQALETYLVGLPTDDNTTVVTGQGTAMEHHTDEAFGYFSAPVDFPTNLTGLKYWSSYSNKVNAAISSNNGMMNNFLALRAAVSNSDYATRDVKITNLRTEWEKLVAASAILELVDAKEAYGASDLDGMRHYLSEALGFIQSMKYSSTKQITNTQINAAAAALGTNFYTISITDIDNAINTINSVYGFNLSAF